MSQALTTHTAALPVIEGGAMENFYQLLNRQPPADAININKLAGGAKYLPIPFLEMKLDELYYGLWTSETTDTKVVGNEYVVTVQVAVYHPVARQWITRTGIGSVPIQQKKGASITDLDAKYTNALQKNAPAAKAFAFKNAVKGFGTIFGRDLNRAEDDIPDYVPGSTQVAVEESKAEKAMAAIAEADSTTLGKLYLKHKSLPGIPAAIMARRKELSSQSA
ncbi:hypothetical protein LEM8419_03517 [Neolewinella maritima]|uniref:Uncharacterized protein n=1 Tax=Neolewinella maritima TaxID=1383882 RepID=A0ABM9B5M8_9BACT|nr:hypothetical protein [Neolewinella maritima]CAH1002645.1 hypothetical protein LEM8419_03517 [Neolewinella maritima]